MLVVFGATGFLGRHVLAAAEECGCPVRAISRGFVPQAGAGAAQWVRADYLLPSAIEAVVFEGDVVVNLSYSPHAEENLALIDILLDVCSRKRVSCFLHCSTAMVAGATRQMLITEETPCLPVDSYERLKLALEDKVLSAQKRGLRTIIVRPTVIIGAGGRNLQTIAQRLVSAVAISSYMRASMFGNRPMHLVPAKTVASAILHLAAMPDRCAGEIFIVAADDDPDNRFPAVERLLMIALGVPSRRVPVLPLPRALLTVALQIRGRSDPALERFYSSQKLRSTGFVPTVTVADGVSEFGRWFRRSQLSVI